ncbi:amidohydrolase family protein [Aegicerativicinus sediminis]|uniref:amidohydrolase family protein n=1 Tax=Aegicerativicinus sediminis TaxID=2893202 RepID=UPI001E548535|nr:amidohydrolase family protein [Aegicerativicinus sediminis]
MKKYISIIVVALVLNSLSFAQQTPAQAQKGKIAITGATAHIGNGEVIENSVIVFENGKLVTVGSSGDTSGANVIDASGKHVYPGFIVPNSTLGLVEIDAVKATDDDAEIGQWNPNIRSIIAYNAESKVVESMRPNGVLLGQITPRSGRISGSSSIVQFDAWNWEDAIIKADEGIHMNWPNSFSRGRWWMGEDPGLKPNSDYEKQVMEIEDYFNSSKTYGKTKESVMHLPYAAMGGLFDGSKTLYIHVNDAKGITDAITFGKKMKLNKVVLVGVSQGNKVADEIKSSNFPVLVQRIHSTPDLDDDDYDGPYKLAADLSKKGILVALEPSGDMERMNSRNLPFYAGTSVKYGLSKEDGLKLITSNPAKILGIDGMYGTLEAGKSATLFISEGDALDIRTNMLSHAFIDGREVSLETHQTKLWHRYADKYKEE